MKIAKLLLPVVSLSMFAGCASAVSVAEKTNSSNEKPVQTTQETDEKDEQNSSQSQSGFVVTSDESVGAVNLGFSLGQFEKYWNLSNPKITDDGEYAYTATDPDGYAYGIFVRTDDQNMVTALSTMMISPIDDDDFWKQAMGLSLEIFHLVPDFESNTFSVLYGNLEGPVEFKKAAAVFGSYAAATAIKFEDDRQLILMQVAAWEADRAAGEPSYEDVNRQADIGLSDSEAIELIENGK